ncbi:hypothetical protein [Mycobacterium marinum]|uniref:hypothetical protein n=1 Tax=Mycobacterium marinum TaxID=1781 RepID=UPI003566F160
MSPPTDDELTRQFTALAWALMKLTMVHRTMEPELLDNPNTLLAPGRRSWLHPTPPRATCT